MIDQGAAAALDRPGFDRSGMAGVEYHNVVMRRPDAALGLADAVRGLAADAVAHAGSDQRGVPLGMADAATALWTRFHKFDAADPRWPDRDRFVLSAGHGAMLLYALLHLSGHDGMGVDELRRYRQADATASGHPALGAHPAIELTSGPLGQGLGAAVGMALAERLLAARFGRSLVDHRTWVVASDGDLMEGLSHEAASLAGHLKLEKLTVLWDDNGVCHDGPTGLASSDDALARFAAYGWAVRRVDGGDGVALAGALAAALRGRKPTLIACHGRPDPAAHRSTEAFELPDHLAHAWRAAGTRGAAARRAWLKRLAKHPMREEFERVIAGRLPDAVPALLAQVRAGLTEAAVPSREASQRVLEALFPIMPELIGGSADLTAQTKTQVAGVGSAAAGSFAGRHIHYGIREHGMAAAMNGIAVHGGLVPYGGTFFVFTDYMRPALRLAAMMRQRVIHVLTHDGTDLGANGATHQPVEHLAGLRAMPNLTVFRPACAVEVAECWELALSQLDGPSLLVLGGEQAPALRGPDDDLGNRSAKGGYVLAEAAGPRRATLIATGTEVMIAMAARAVLAAEGIDVAVVSLPCWELFARTSVSYRAQVLGTAPRIGLEAGCGFGWERWLGDDGVFIGRDGFGASGPAEELCRALGLTVEGVATAVRLRLAN